MDGVVRWFVKMLVEMLGDVGDGVVGDIVEVVGEDVG